MKRRALRLALLSVALVAACAGLARHLLALETRIGLEEETRAEVREDLSAYRLQDPAAWARHQRQADARIAGLRREQNVTRGLFFAVVLLGLGAAGWLFWPAGARRAAAQQTD